MSDIVKHGPDTLRVSRLSWGRVRRTILNTAVIAAAVGATAFYMNGGLSSIWLRADGYVVRDRVAVAPAFDGMVTAIYVRPGDHVEKGQPIAVVKSLAISRTLAELSAEKARLTSRIAELEARRRIVADTLPLATANAQQAADYLKTLTRAGRTGLTVNKSLQEMSSASLSATEHSATLKAEQESLGQELAANNLALDEATSAYVALNDGYAGGVLRAAASGDIAATVAPVGSALSAASASVADIYTGESYVLAYLPDAYAFEVSEGQLVGVKARNEIFNARVERILPVAQALPDDLRTPNRARERGRLVRIALTDTSALPVDQSVRITSCLVDDCRAGGLEIARELGNRALDSVKAQAVAASGDAKQAMTAVGEKASAALHSQTVTTVRVKAQALGIAVKDGLTKAQRALDQAWSNLPGRRPANDESAGERRSAPTSPSPPRPAVDPPGAGATGCEARPASRSSCSPSLVANDDRETSAAHGL